MGWVELLIAALVLGFVHLTGMNAGKKKAEREASKELADLKEGVADDKLKAKQSMSRDDRLRLMLAAAKERMRRGPD